MNGPLPIEFTEIEACLNLHGIDDLITRIEYTQIIARLDKTHRDFRSKTAVVETPKVPVNSGNAQTSN